MPDGLYREDSLPSGERREFEEDLIAFCDRALDLLGHISGIDVLYAGGAAPLWLEGLAERIGPEGSLTSVEADAERAAQSRRWIEGAELPCPVSVVTGDVLSPPFAVGSFDLVYSAGLLHELDASRGSAESAIRALVATLRPGGRLATDDFVDSLPAVQLEDEALEVALREALHGERPYGVGSPERLLALHADTLESVVWRVLAPFELRHLDTLFLSERDPLGYEKLPEIERESLRGRRRDLRERVRREGYTRPATLYVEGRRPG